MLVTPFGVASQGHQPAQVILKLQASGLLAPVEAVRCEPVLDPLSVVHAGRPSGNFVDLEQEVSKHFAACMV